MGWSIGYDSNWKRDIGYGVPAQCDHPDCIVEIDHGLAYVCGSEPFGGDHGCGLYFCHTHLMNAVRGRGNDRDSVQLCDCCLKRRKPFEKKPDIRVWIEHKLTDESWQRWRDENADEVAVLRTLLAPVAAGASNRE